MTQRTITFDEPAAGKATQLAAVRDVMSDGQWHASFEIQEILKSRGIMASESSITARLRQLRACGLTIECKCFRRGMYGYRVV